MSNTVDCYDYPQYWDVAFSEDTRLEADFVVAAAKKYCDFEAQRFLEPGCGGGRLLVELAGRGLDAIGWDLSEAAVQFANERLRKQSPGGRAVVADMRTAKVSQPVDVAYCLVNTFRHLLTEDDALAHLQNISRLLRPGGLYVIGMHLFPPDADEEDEEEWSVEADDICIDIRLEVVSCCRQERIETLRFDMTVNDGSNEQSTVQTDYAMRLYEAADMKSLLAKVSDFELLDVYDFWYDIQEPLELSDELGDTVFVLRKV